MVEARHKKKPFCCITMQQNSENGDFNGNAITIICNNPSKNKGESCCRYRNLKRLGDRCIFILIHLDWGRRRMSVKGIVGIAG